MFIRISLLLFSLITRIQCQNSIDTTVQSTCFNDISIFKSNSPHVIQKKGDGICVAHEGDNTVYQKVIHEEVYPNVLPRSINIDNSVSAPLGTATNLSVYQAGTSVFRYIVATNTPTYYTLPVPFFNSLTCSGSQPITYMNDFSSTCNQPVTAQTCISGLDTTKYISGFCLIRSPSDLIVNGGNITHYVCCTGTGSPSSWTGSSCSNPLQNLNLIIYYSNPDGIQNCSVSFDTANTTASGTVPQTYSVRFVKVGLSNPTTSRSGNPGYIQGAPLIAGNSVGGSINRTSGLTILQASTFGFCPATKSQVINFGVDVQSTCLYQLVTPGSCPNISDLLNIFTSNDPNNLYVASKGSSDPSNTADDWIPVTFCVSMVGSISGRVCQQNSVPIPATGQCYTRLDVQITFANFGSVTNAQPILGAVIYHFQSVALTSATTLLMTETVTFQDVSDAPVTGGDQIPRPNTRLPGDFFYPFTLNRGTNALTFSSIFYLSIFSLLFLM